MKRTPTPRKHQPDEDPSPQPEEQRARQVDNRVVALAEEIIGTQWLPEGLTAEERMQRFRFVLDRLRQIKPAGPIETMLAEQMIGAHNAARECLRRAMLPNQTLEGRSQNLKYAEKFLAIYTRQLEVLDKHRGKGQQKVTVEHVHVEAGGQAIVGNVEAEGRRRRKKGQAAALAHDPEVPFEAPAPVATATRRKG